MRLFNTACTVFQLLNQKNGHTIRKPFPSILLFINVLQTSLLLFTSLDKFRHFTTANPFHHHAPSISVLYSHVLETGWCRNQLEHLFPRFPSCTLWFLSSFRRPASNFYEHRACSTESSCVAHNINEDEFQCKHVILDCECSFLAAPVEDMIDTLERGEIPLLSCQRGPGNQLELSYVEATSEKKYIAISHLWADALGNPHAHQLPRCQMERLVSRALSIPSGAVSFMNKPINETPRYAQAMVAGDGHFLGLIFCMDADILVPNLGVLRVTFQEVRDDDTRIALA
jgi:hypothetical protein